MVAHRFATGEIVFREGDPSDRVGRVLSGEVEVLRNHAGHPVVIGRVGPREFVGEMGVIEGRPRSATVRALTETAIDFVDKETFLRQVSEDRTTAFELLLRLCMRLRDVDAALAEADVPPRLPADAAAAERQPPSGPRLTIYAESDRLADLLPAEGHALELLPFFVGRALTEDDTKPPINIDFTIRDEAPHRLSRVHFAIMRLGDDLIVRDFGSRLGTLVNGDFLGGDLLRTNSAPLKPGDNVIVAGGSDSPYAFRLRLQ